MKLRPRYRRAVQTGLRQALQLTIRWTIACLIFIAGIAAIAATAYFVSPILGLLLSILFVFLTCWLGATYDALRQEEKEAETNYEYYLR